MTTPLPDSIDHAGKVDVSAALTAFFKAVPTGSTVVLPTGGVLRCDGKVSIVDKDALRVVPNRCQLKRVATPTASNVPVLEIIGGKQATFGLPEDRLRIDGGYPAAGIDSAVDLTREGQHAVALFGVQNFTGHFDTAHTRADGAYIHWRKVGPHDIGARSYRWSTNVHLTGDYKHCGRQGITILGAECVLVSQFDVDDCRRSNVNAEANAAAFTGSKSVWFVSGRFGPARLNLLAASGTGPVEGYHFIDIDCDRDFNAIVRDDSGARRSDFEFDDVRVTVPGGGDEGLLEFYRVDGVKVNRITGDLFKPVDAGSGDEVPLVYAEGCTDVEVDPTIDLGSNPNAGLLVEA